MNDAGGGKLPPAAFQCNRSVTSAVAQEALALGNPADQALVRLGWWLREAGYRFTAATPGTHAIVNARAPSGNAPSLGDIFGWSRPFPAAALPPSAIELLEQGHSLSREGELLRSQVRFSTLGEMLFLHSAFPTLESDAVFFGPDTYRFIRFIEQALGRLDVNAVPATVFDIGCGTGAGGLATAARLPAGCELVLADINAKALHAAWVNARFAGNAMVTFRHGDLYASFPGSADLIIANPPYLVDGEARVYRDGGGALGSDLSLRIVHEGLPRLRPGGAMVLYTGAPIVSGFDALHAGLAREAGAANCALAYEELDPDVFGEELHRPAYALVDRIAAVGAVMRKPCP